MNRSSRPASFGWAILVVTVSALALAGCGRKGALDLPPQASVAPTATGTPGPAADADSAASKGSSLFSTSTGDDGTPSAAKGRKRSFLLDPLLGN